MSEKSKLWYLENFNLFKGLSMGQMMELEKTTIMSTAQKNDYIYFPEDPSNSVFFLKEGRVKIASSSDDGRETIKTILNPGELFGELSLAGEPIREEYAQALEDNVLICAVGLEDMEKLLGSNPKLNLRVTKLMGLKLRRMERKVNDLIFKDARTRIIDFIKEMAETIGTKAGDETLIKHKLTHQEIANLTASSRQTVTTILNELKEKNVINFERKRILVRDLNKLE